MRSRLFGPAGLCFLFAGVAALVVGGLAWVTVASLEVEAAQRDAAARADRANTERLALWRLDTHVLPAFGLENNRPFAHYTALHAPYPAVDADQNAPAPGSLRLPSPLLSADLPPWMLLHFQLDPQAGSAGGWTSPQVLPPDLSDKLQSPPLNLKLYNCTSDRERHLADLAARFPAADVIRVLATAEPAGEDGPPYVVPVPFSDEPSAAKPGWSIDDADPAEGRGRRVDVGDGDPRLALGTDRPSAKLAGGVRANTAPLPAPAPPPPSPPGAAAPGGVPGVVANAAGPAAPAATSNGLNPSPQGGGFGAGGQQQLMPYSLPGDAPPAGLVNQAREFQARARATQKSQESRGGYENVGGGRAAAADGKGDGERAAGRADAPAKDKFAPAPGVGGPPQADALRKGAEPADAKKADRADPKQGPAAAAGADPPPRPLGRDANAEKEQAGDDQLALGRELAEAPGQPGARKAGPVVQPAAVHLGPLRPHWLTAADGTEVLVLVRAARLEDRTVYQGVLLDWPAVQRALTEQVADLFPAATVTPVRTAGDLSPERAMTALPAQLDPGPAPEPPPAGRTPLRIGLALAWAAALLALAAVGFGGRALVRLSEDRIRFVSAVTHELRTPLTSLRLYLDLLTSGMVADPDKQAEYLRTLAAESDRLNRLIENVLDFARLEKQSAHAVLRPTKVFGLLEDVRATWADRCQAAGKELVVISTLPPDGAVGTDPRVAAQVLGNLIDNARKYAKDSADNRIWVWARPGGRGRVVLEVEDRGPGVPIGERGTVFRPFRRGTGADTTAGGAGLGLALAAHWAGVLGGRLSYRVADGGVGACFRLELPAA